VIVAGRTRLWSTFCFRLEGDLLVQTRTVHSIIRQSSRKMADNEEHRQPGTSEEEPLLGRRGDASQEEGLPLYQNLVIGE